MVVCNETTEKLRLQRLSEKAEKDLRSAREEAESQRDQLAQFFMQAPAGICVLGGEDFVFELVNPSYQEILPNGNLLNRKLFDALPELRDQPYINF